MIYGSNFGYPAIPSYWFKRFAARLNQKRRRVQPSRGCYWQLQGVTDCEDDLTLLFCQAENGRRTFFTCTRQLKGVTWYGLYIH